ncbi:MAG: RNA polymerase sigma factor [Limisphaerales bacterium]
MDEPQTQAEWIGAVLERHGAALTRYAASITGDEDSARDVVQDTFVRLCATTPEHLDGRLVPWLFTVCRNRALDVQRKSHRLVPFADDSDSLTPDDGPNPAMALEHRETAGLALDLLETLTPQQREVVRLKFQAGLSYQQIAEVTRLTATNVGFILHTAIKTLRRRLQQSL